MRPAFLIGALLWLPVLRSSLAGGLDADAAALRLALAIAVAAAGWSVVRRLVNAYRTAAEAHDREEPATAPRRRRDDPPAVEPVG